MKVKINPDIDQYNKGFSHGVSVKQLLGCAAAVIAVTLAVAVCLMFHLSYLIGVYIGCIPAAGIIMMTVGEREGYGYFEILADRMSRKSLEFEADEAEDEIRLEDEEEDHGVEDESESV